LHAALLEHVPSRSIHLGKRLARAEANQHGVTLHFEDGSEAHGDILIGADGIRSVCDHLSMHMESTLLTPGLQKVRQSFVPDYKLQFSGKVFMRSTFDASWVEGKIPGLPADSMHWV
jgi:salicylate hydroxylase